MCLYIKDQKLHLCTSPKIVYKTLIIDKGFIQTPYTDYRINSRVIKPDKTWDFVDLLDGVVMGFKGVRSLDIGFIHGTLFNRVHKCGNPIHKVVKCIIPFGSIYALGSDNDICATKMIIDKDDWQRLLVLLQEHAAN